MQIKIGCDPELFCINKKTNLPVSVHDFIKGDKFFPLKVPMGAIQVDGTAAEFNIDPADDRNTFIRNIKHVSGILGRAVSAKNKDYILAAVPTVIYSKEYMDSLPDEAKELGCEPDYSAYTMNANRKPDASSTMRTGSGHIHVGWTEGAAVFSDEHFKLCADITKELDTVLHRYSHLWDKDTKRRMLYGEVGAFRPKPYGVEYRVLSNAWLNNDWTMQYIFDATKTAVLNFFKGVSARSLFENVSPNSFHREMNILASNDFEVVSRYAPKEVLSNA